MARWVEGSVRVASRSVGKHGALSIAPGMLHPPPPIAGGGVRRCIEAGGDAFGARPHGPISWRASERFFWILSMVDYLLDFMVLPMPILWLLLLGVVLWRWRRLSRAVIFAAIALFLAVSLPASGKLLVSNLQSGAPAFDGKDPDGILGILVPSGGTFDDGTGRWWPTRSSARRLTAALRIRDQLGLPIILSGGSPSRGQPPEVETIATLYGLQGEHIRLETRSRNSSETAEAVAAMLAGKPKPRVILVTSATHIARMSAALRHYGVTALVMPADDAGLEPLNLSDFLPSYRGLKLTRSAQWEFMGIAWYLFTERIDFADLSPS